MKQIIRPSLDTLRLILTAAILFLLPFAGWSSSANAEKPKQQEQISLLHTPKKAEELPHPGQDITLIAKLTGTRDTSLKLAAALVKDGRFMQVNATEAYLNEYDQPTYEITFPAPVAEMSYQLVIFSPDGTASMSPRYVVRRTCLPNVQLASPEIAEHLQGFKLLERLFSESVNLEHDLAGYERAMTLVDELQKKVNRQ